MAFRHGKGGAAKIGATVLKVLSWTVDDQVDMEESTNTASGGHKERTFGCDGLAWTIEAQYDAAAGPGTLGLIPGTQLGTLTLSNNGTVAADAYVMTPADVEKVSIKMVVKNVITYSVSGYSSGAFTRPTA